MHAVSSKDRADIGSSFNVTVKIGIDLNIIYSGMISFTGSSTNVIIIVGLIMVSLTFYFNFCCTNINFQNKFVKIFVISCF